MHSTVKWTNSRFLSRRSSASGRFISISRRPSQFLSRPTPRLAALKNNQAANLCIEPRSNNQGPYFRTIALQSLITALLSLSFGRAYRSAGFGGRGLPGVPVLFGPVRRGYLGSLDHSARTSPVGSSCSSMPLFSRSDFRIKTGRSIVGADLKSIVTTPEMLVAMNTGLPIRRP